MKPVTVSPWDQFSEVETAATAKLAGTFPVAIGMRLKIGSYYGKFIHIQPLISPPTLINTILVPFRINVQSPPLYSSPHKSDDNALFR